MFLKNMVLQPKIFLKSIIKNIFEKKTPNPLFSVEKGKEEKFEV